MDLWLQYMAKAHRYFPFSSKFTLGTYGELALSTRKLLHNYTATIIQAPYFVQHHTVVLSFTKLSPQINMRLRCQTDL
jgi:hypothetical protein